MSAKKKHPSSAPEFESVAETRPTWWLIRPFDGIRRKIKSLYAWMVGWAETKKAEKALAGFAFAESSFFPIPPDPLLIAMTVAKPRKYLRFATICTFWSVMGGLFGYIIGAGLFEAVGRPIIEAYHLHDEFAYIGERYQQNSFLAIFTASFTPIPYKLITISAGVFKVSLFEFVTASVIGRGGRFFMVAFLMHHFGQRFKDRIEKYVDILSLVFVILIILGILSVKFL